MRRDLDFLRDLMLEIEDRLPEEDDLRIEDLIKMESPSEPLIDADEEVFAEYELEKAVYDAEYKKYVYYIQLLLDAKFIIAIDTSTLSRSSYIIQRLTSSGCDYIDSIRSKQIWDMVKKKIENFGGSLALETIKSLAISCAKTVLGL